MGNYQSTGTALSRFVSNVHYHRPDDVRTVKGFLSTNGIRLPHGYIRTEPSRPNKKLEPTFIHQYFSVPDARLTFGGSDYRCTEFNKPLDLLSAHLYQP